MTTVSNRREKLAGSKVRKSPSPGIISYGINVIWNQYGITFGPLPSWDRVIFNESPSGIWNTPVRSNIPSGGSLKRVISVEQLIFGDMSEGDYWIQTPKPAGSGPLPAVNGLAAATSVLSFADMGGREADRDTNPVVTKMERLKSPEQDEETDSGIDARWWTAVLTLVDGHAQKTQDRRLERARLAAVGLELDLVKVNAMTVAKLRDQLRIFKFIIEDPELKKKAVWGDKRRSELLAVVIAAVNRRKDKYGNCLLYPL
ncbi:hypothetical protein C8R45DRAFT_930553 [Mycena sanguinolenta]|nr:hypothetical protein C8R45DRAFT_930553 [Mycena sanguinolenta]